MNAPITMPKPDATDTDTELDEALEAMWALGDALWDHNGRIERHESIMGKVGGR